MASSSNGDTPETEAEDEAQSERETDATSVSDALPDRPSMAEGGRFASAVETFSSSLVNLLVSLLIGFSKILPFTERFFRGLIGAGYRGLYGTTSSDAIGHIKVGNELKLVPVTYDYDKQRYENQHGDYWNVASEGDYEYRVAGKVPAVWASAASNELGSHVQAEVAEALDVGDHQPLYDADVDVILDAQSGAQGAIADGGQGYRLNVDAGEWVDELVDLSVTGDARVVSMEKYYETYPSVVAPEEMKMQEERGKMSESDKDYAKLALKMMLIAMAIIAIVVLGPTALELLFGGGGGGDGGSMLPMMLGVLG